MEASQRLRVPTGFYMRNELYDEAKHRVEGRQSSFDNVNEI